ncbi:MAG: DUF2281 domain-containing protein [Runella slithyformis]|nr:MAG: DUF2281 domain-containing protein [Runella slithyformis]TAF29176.1 MAG: DUF2281 domain-containing protein [Runella slithyformis]TAF48099.1 MAG: DUF2281 domain-containing protein [Runella slithyformis]TAF82889.1 MAG: DUF2281 domain-containing protein [Runella slithyformis]
MLTTIEGTYDNGVIFLNEKPLLQKKTKVLITFLDESTFLKKRKAGGLAGQINITDDFNDPIDDLKEYM